MSRAMHHTSEKATGRVLFGPARVAGDQSSSAAGLFPRLIVGRLVAGDTAAALVAAALCLGAYAARWTGPPLLVHAVVVIALPAAWVCALSVARCYARTTLDDGLKEFRHVLVAAGLVLAAVALVGWGGRVDVPRGLVAVALPATTALTLAQRRAHRRWLHRAHAAGRLLRRTVLVGERHDVALMYRYLRHRPAEGYRVIGCCLPASEGGGPAPGGLPILGRPADVVTVARRYAVSTVAVLPSAGLDGREIRRIDRELRASRADLLLAPTVTGGAGPPMIIRSLGGMSLVQIGDGELLGARGLVKSAFDRLGASLALLLIAPMLVAIALAVAATGRGPVLVRHERLGLDGRAFGLLSFRTTSPPDDDVATPDGADECTRVGRFLQRHCLDELPQLLNVLSGDMSFVGPRPPLPPHAERPTVPVRRWLAVKPGLTGIRPGGDRSSPRWKEPLPADVLYAENWSLLGDLAILWRACRSAVRPTGAA